MKRSDFDGHAKRSFNNIHAYSNVYGSKCTGIMNLPHDSPNNFFAEAYSGNKCVLAGNDAYLDLGSGCVPNSTLWSRIILGNNTIYTPNACASAPTRARVVVRDIMTHQQHAHTTFLAATSVSCGKSYTFDEWTALGLDEGTAIATLPSADTIIGWARALLKMTA